jgi:peroxiredoxin
MFCRNQLGQLANIQDRLEKKGIGLAAISVDEPEDTIKFAGQIGARYPLLRDDALHVSIAYGVAMEGRDIPVPAVFVVLPDGRIFWRQVGESVSDRPTNAQILDVVDRAVEASAGARPLSPPPVRL